MFTAFPADTTVRITVQYFAQLRERRGCAEEVLACEATDPAALYDELCTRHGFVLSRDHLQVAVNDRMTDWRTTLKDGDTVLFIPPVAGG